MALFGSNFKIDNAVSDFPDPDSPTIPRVLDLFKENEISFKTCFLPSLFENDNDRFLTSSKFTKFNSF
jgi:hypothetical protein